MLDAPRPAAAAEQDQDRLLYAQTSKSLKQDAAKNNFNTFEVQLRACYGRNITMHTVLLICRRGNRNNKLLSILTPL
jgi:hypothetical protein